MRFIPIIALSCMLIMMQSQFVFAEEAVLETDNIQIDEVLAAPETIELTACHKDCTSCDGCDVCGHGCGLLDGLIKPTSQCFSELHLADDKPNLL